MSRVRVSEAPRRAPGREGPALLRVASDGARVPRGRGAGGVAAAAALSPPPAAAAARAAACATRMRPPRRKRVH